MNTYQEIKTNEEKITWAAAIAFKIALNFKNPYRKIAIITPKGTGKSENITQWQVQLQAKEIILPEGEILNIKNTQASNKETLFENLKDYYNKWNLPHIATWNNNQQNIVSNNHRISFKGKDKQVTQLTGWKRPVSLMFEDEALNGDDSLKNEKWLEDQQAKDLNIFSSVSRNFLDNPKTKWTAKSITATNLHYRDGLYYPMFESLDTEVVLAEGKQKGYSVRIISEDHPSNAFGVDVMMLFISPELNQYLPEHVKNIKYKDKFKQETMKKFVPDLTTDPLYVHAPYVKYIKYRNNVNKDIHYCGIGIDPASGRDEFVVSHIGVVFDPQTKVPIKIVPLWFTVLKTNQVEHDSIQTAIQNFYKDVFSDFVSLRAAAHTSDLFFVTVDSNQQTMSDQLFKYIKTELFKILIGNNTDKKLEFEFIYKVTDKNKTFKPQVRAEILNYLISNDKIISFKNITTEKWANQLLKIKRQFKLNSNDEFKILSNGGDDLYDAFNMALEGLLQRENMLKLFDDPKTFYALIKTSEE